MRNTPSDSLRSRTQFTIQATRLRLIQTMLFLSLLFLCAPSGVKAADEFKRPFEQEKSQPSPKTLGLRSSCETCSMNPRPAESLTPELTSEIQESLWRDLHRVIESNFAASSLEIWNSEGLTPHRLFEETLRVYGAPGAQLFCTVLFRLPLIDLALFEPILAEAALPEGCATSLKRDLDVYWQGLDLQFRSQTQKSLNLESPDPTFEDPVISRRDDGALPLSDPSQKSLVKAPALLPFESEFRIVDSSTEIELTNGNLKLNQVAITLDDGPHPQRTDQILMALSQAQVLATFFQVGKNAKTYPDIVRRVIDAGHTVGSHSMSHRQLTSLPLSEAEREIDEGALEVSLAAGASLPFFRFPYGSRNPELLRSIQQREMTSFYWNMDSLDWKLRDPLQIFQNVMSQFKRQKSGIILMHDIHPQTVLALPLILDALRKLKVTTVSFLQGSNSSTLFDPSK